MFVVSDWGWKMLNWWIVIPVLAPASHPQSNEDQIVLQRPQLDPVFVANVGEIMKWCHHPQDQSFREMLTSFCSVAKQSLLVAGFWGNRFCTVECPPSPEPAGGRSEGEWAKIALFLGRTRVSKLCMRGKSYNLFDQEKLGGVRRQDIFATSVHRHSSESGNISGLVELYVKDRRPLSVVSTPRRISVQKLSY